MDEAYTDEEAEELFGNNYKKYHEVSSDEKIREAGTAKEIADYVRENSLNVTKYQIVGNDPEELHLFD